MKFSFLKRIAAITAASVISLSAIDFPGLGNNNPLSKSENNKPMVYKDMLAFFAQSNNPEQLAAIGALYAVGTNEPDSTGDIIEPNPALAEKYLLESAKLGNIKAYGILGGLFFLQPNMRQHDADHKKARTYLEKAMSLNDYESGIILSNLYIEAKEEKKAIDLLLLLDQKNDSSAQLSLALFYNKGIYSELGKPILKRDQKVAEYFLTRACLNPKQDQNVKMFCEKEVERVEVQ